MNPVNAGALALALGLASQDADLGPQSVAGTPDPVADYETFVPHQTQPRLPAYERILLKSYLDQPGSAALAQLLGVYHLNLSLLRRQGGEAVAHSIIAKYFLSRAADLGDERRWLKVTIAQLGQGLDQLIASAPGADDPVANAREDLWAHKQFREAFFNNHEERRYNVLRWLLDDFVQHPNNTLTNTYLTTTNIWNGGEADADDPTILYSFVLSSWFSVRAQTLAQQREELWQAEPARFERFRLATLIGGWTVPARRWLARLHGDDAAVAALDEEHRKWLAINPAFHSVTVGLMLFPEKEGFAEGFAAWQLGRDYCLQIAPRNLSCINWPRVSFNVLSFFLGEVDFNLKAGRLDQARELLAFRHLPAPPFADSYAHWDLGRGPWEHREQNLERIAELYANDDPKDDPAHFLMKKHRWGPDTFVCQVCHTHQSQVWPDGAVEETLATTDEFPPIGMGNWPEVSTTWYGALRSRVVSMGSER